MARRKRELKLKKVPNILDSYIKFKDLDDEGFNKTFGGTKETIINSWLYLLYIELKQQFEAEPEAAEESQEAEGGPEARLEPMDEKTQKRKARRRKKRSQGEGEEATDQGKEEELSDSADSEEADNLYGVKEADAE